MKSFCLLVLGLLTASLPGRAATAETADAETRRKEVRQTFLNDIVPFLKANCFECHGNKKRKAGVDFSRMINRPEAADYRRVWQLALNSVRDHEMPPRDADKQPTDAERQRFAD